jgi:type IV secretory pathway VirB4 component
VWLDPFQVIDSRCRTGRPTHMYLDEAWLMLARPRFAERFDQWLRDKPKQNAAVILATHSLGDLVNSSLRTIVTESCQTKIFLPNAAARTETSRALYRGLDLNDQHIERLGEMVSQREYLYISPYGSRILDFQAGAVARLLCGARMDEQPRVRALIEKHGEMLWVPEYLRENGCEKEALWWQRHQLAKGKLEEFEHHEKLWADIDLGNGHDRAVGME